MRVYLVLVSPPTLLLTLIRAIVSGDLDTAVKICADCGLRITKPALLFKPYILQSIIYTTTSFSELIPSLGDYFLDSGVFTFLKQNTSGNVDWNKYIEKYAQFINTHNIKKYFELDIDHLVGWNTVKKMTAFLKKETGVTPIPVWHANRGKEGFIEMCQEYDYVSIGSDSQHNKYLKFFIDTAHLYGCKIHGLGYTQTKQLEYLKFDSVDSSSWTANARYGGMCYKFNGKNMTKVCVPRRLQSAIKMQVHEFMQWYLYQQYMDKR